MHIEFSSLWLQFTAPDLYPVLMSTEQLNSFWLGRGRVGRLHCCDACAAPRTKWQRGLKGSTLLISPTAQPSHTSSSVNLARSQFSSWHGTLLDRCVSSSTMACLSQLMPACVCVCSKACICIYQVMCLPLYTLFFSWLYICISDTPCVSICTCTCRIHAMPHTSASTPVVPSTLLFIDWLMVRKGLKDWTTGSGVFRWVYLPSQSLPCLISFNHLIRLVDLSIEVRRVDQLVASIIF